MLNINIKDKLEQKKMNKSQFAKQIQVCYPTACAIYTGDTTRISLDILERICIVLECTPNDIFVSDDPAFNNIIQKSV